MIVCCFDVIFCDDLCVFVLLLILFVCSCCITRVFFFVVRRFRVLIASFVFVLFLMCC